MKVNIFVWLNMALFHIVFTLLNNYVSFSLEIERQIQQIQAQRSNLPKVDIGEKVCKIINFKRSAFSF